MVRLFKEKSTQINRDATEKWEEVQIALGVAVFDPTIDRTAEDVIRRADELMYEEKRKRKASKA